MGHYFLYTQYDKSTQRPCRPEINWSIRGRSAAEQPKVPRGPQQSDGRVAHARRDPRAGGVHLGQPRAAQDGAELVRRAHVRADGGAAMRADGGN